MSETIEHRAVELLYTTLLDNRFGALVDEPQPWLTERGLGGAASAFFGLPVIATLGLELSWLIALLAVVAFFVGAYFLGRATTGELSGMVAAISLMALWASAAVWSALSPAPGSIAITHGVPAIAVLAAVFFRIDLRSLVRNLPLLAPLALIVLLIPLLTADVWEAASDLTPTRLGALALVLVVPVLWALYRQLREYIGAAYADSAAAMGDEEIIEVLRRRVARASSPEDAEWLVENAVPLVQDTVDTPEIGNVFAAQVAQKLEGSLARFVRRRLVPTALGVGAVSFAYIYCVGALAVSRATAHGWTGERIPTRDVDFIAGLTVPVGPYVKVAALLGVAATAIYLALVQTEERYARGLTDALLKGPTYQSLALGVPYLALTAPQPVEGTGNPA